MAIQAPFYHPDVLQQQPVCSIIIPLFNRVEHTRNCLEALANNTGNGIPFELILIDNASTDATADFLRTLTGNVTVLTNKIQFSVAKSCNQGARLAVGNYLVFLRQTVCPGEKWLEALVGGPAQNYAEIAGARILSFDDRVQHAGVAFDEEKLPYNIFSGFAGSSAAVTRNRLMQAVSGDCLLVRRELFQRLGGFDEGYLNGLEDIDFCLRAGAGGAKVMYNPECLLLSAGHAESGAAGYQNMDRFLSSWREKIAQDDIAYYQAEGFVKKTMPDGRTYILPSEGQRQEAPSVVTAAPSPAADATKSSARHLSPQELYQKAQAFLADGNQEEAIRTLELSVAGTPAFAPAFNDLAVLLVRRGDLERAVTLHERAVELAPDNLMFRKNLADLYFAGCRRTDEAIMIYTDIIAKNPEDVEALCSFAQIGAALDRPDEAGIFLEKALQLDPANEVARGLLQNLSSSKAMAPPAPPSRSPQELYEASRRKVQSGDRIGAINTLEQLLTVEPSFALAHNDLGVLYLQAGDKERSLHHHQQAVALAPDNATFQKNLAELYLVVFGRTDDAIFIFVDLLEKRPDDVEVLLSLSKICVAQDRPDEAKIFSNKVLELEPGNDTALEIISLKESSVAPAVESTIPSAEDAYRHAQQLAGIGRTEEAIAILERLTGEQGETGVAWNDLGVLYTQQKSLGKALQCHENAVNVDPANSLFRKNLANFYFVKAGRTDEAIELYVKLLNEQPDDVDSLSALGIISAAVGRPDEARTFISRVLALEPGNAAAHDFLAQINGSGDFFLRTP